MPTADYLAANPFADPETPGSTSAAAYFKYDSNIVALRDNPNNHDIESVITYGSSLGSVLAILDGDQMFFWELRTGAADSGEPTMQVAPEDYSSTYNDKHWHLLVQPSEIADAASLSVSGTLSLGGFARLVALSNGVALEIKNTLGNWIRHTAWQE